MASHRRLSWRDRRSADFPVPRAAAASRLGHPAAVGCSSRMSSGECRPVSVCRMSCSSKGGGTTVRITAVRITRCKQRPEARAAWFFVLLTEKFSFSRVSLSQVIISPGFSETQYYAKTTGDGKAACYIASPRAKHDDRLDSPRWKRVERTKTKSTSSTSESVSLMPHRGSSTRACRCAHFERISNACLGARVSGCRFSTVLPPIQKRRLHFWLFARHPDTM